VADVLGAKAQFRLSVPLLAHAPVERLLSQTVPTWTHVGHNTQRAARAQPPLLDVHGVKILGAS